MNKWEGNRREIERKGLERVWKEVAEGANSVIVSPTQTTTRHYTLLHLLRSCFMESAKSCALRFPSHKSLHVPCGLLLSVAGAHSLSLSPARPSLPPSSLLRS
jgi:hypothetical protein